MKKSTKKGFTLVELVIVIAIIAILAAVLIPTFSGIVEKANKSAVLQSAKNAYTELLAAEEVKADPDKLASGTLTTTEIAELDTIKADTGVTAIEVTKSGETTTSIKFTTSKGYVSYDLSTHKWGDVTLGE